jgi:membrane-anchored protein YejM (alkaline phosphatase superfamily)
MPEVVAAPGHPRRASIFGPVLLGSYAVMLLNLARNIGAVPVGGALAAAWIVSAWLAWSAVFVLVVVLPIALLDRVLRLGVVAQRLGPWSRRARVALLTLLVLVLATLQVFIFVDAQVFRIFGFHFNGFVWNLLTVPGGVESMGAGPWTIVGFVVVAVAALAVQAGIVVYAVRRARRSVGGRRRRWGVLAGVALVLLLGFERMTLGLADAANQRPVLAAAGAFPLLPPVRMHSFAKSIGIEAAQQGPDHLKVDALRVRYPLAPVTRDPAAPRYDIVWLVSESWRADMLDPAIMPATCAFAAQALDFRHHFSGGNGTRMGMFSMFYGLYGSYWFPFLAENRAPVLMDVLREGGWDIEAFTSARFSFPEMDETVFAGVPPERLHEGNPDLQGWENDRLNVDKLLAAIDSHPPGQPFFAFMFFESPHARYYFPPESVIAEPYLEELNYATVDLERDMPLIKNRYINACHHLDSQFARVIEHLRETGRLEHTVVVLTGDHGEEFMETGRWGHHSDFSDAQTRTPLVLWIPGQAARQVTDRTSHLDIAPTLLTLLGVPNAPVDYSLGRDLLAPGARSDCVVADWDHLALFDDEYKAVFPTGQSIERLRLTTAADQPVDDEAHFWTGHRERITQFMDEIARFSR